MSESNQTSGDEMMAQLLPREVLAMFAGSATELARRWLDDSKSRGYLESGWGVAVEMKLAPAPATVSISFIDPSDMTRYPHATFNLS